MNEDALSSALELGGLAVPSFAVSKTAYAEAILNIGNPKEAYSNTENNRLMEMISAGGQEQAVFFDFDHIIPDEIAGKQGGYYSVVVSVFRKNEIDYSRFKKIDLEKIKKRYHQSTHTDKDVNTGSYRKDSIRQENDSVNKTFHKCLSPGSETRRW